MKRLVQYALAVSFALVLCGCGATASTPVADTTTPETTGESTSTPDEDGAVEEEQTDDPAVAVVDGTPEAIITQIQQDFQGTAQGLLDEQAALFTKTGDTLDGYTANIEAVREWYNLAINESEALGERTIENARQYYRAVVATIDHDDDDALDDALDDFYDLIYDDAFDDYYDAIYDDAFSEMYDYYHDGSIDDAYDTIPYDEWYDLRSDAYDDWHDARSDVYDAWHDYRSDIYDEWSDINSGFYDNEFDIDEILRLKD